VSRPAAAGRPLETARPARAAAWPRLSLLASPAALVAALVALGAGLRFYALGGRSFWIDEVSTTDALWLPSPGDVFNWCRSFQQGPLFFLADWQAAHYGIDEFTLRVPSALAGTLAVYFAFRLGDALYGRATGALTALLMATMFFPVWYSQEARPYAFMILLATAQAYYAFQAVRLGRARDWAGLAAATLLGLYNHYLALAPTAACAVFIAGDLAVRGWRAWRRRPGAGRQAVLVGVVAAADCAALVAVGYLPWLRSLLQVLEGDPVNAGYLPLHQALGRSPAAVARLADTFGFRGLLAVLLGRGRWAPCCARAAGTGSRRHSCWCWSQCRWACWRSSSTARSSRSGPATSPFSSPRWRWWRRWARSKARPGWRRRMRAGGRRPAPAWHRSRWPR